MKARRSPRSDLAAAAGVTMAVALGAVAAPGAASAQGVVVDEGTFAVSLDGRRVGTEEFTIRRAGIDAEDVVFATATVDLTRAGEEQQIRILLRAVPADGVPKCEGNQPCYQVDVVGSGAMSLRLGLAGRRYVARIVHSAGEEIREFPAAPGTRIVESHVAHLYYFLRDVQPGVSTPVLSPRDRSRTSLVAGRSTEEQIQLGPNVVQARRVEFSAGADRRVVWFDRLGRVLRVSVPSRSYLAERTDLVG